MHEHLSKQASAHHWSHKHLSKPAHECENILNRQEQLHVFLPMSLGFTSDFRPNHSH